MMDKTSLSERDICSQFITPALHRAGWDAMTQIREEVSFTKGRIVVRGKMVHRGQANLDIKSPHAAADDYGDPEELLAKLDVAEAETARLREALRGILAEALAR